MRKLPRTNLTPEALSETNVDERFNKSGCLPFMGLNAIKRLIWLYFWLLIFEGVLRKWVLPYYSTPLLVVRDPVVLAIYTLALFQGRFPLNRILVITVVLGALSVAASLAGGGQLIITLFGFRANFLHLPLIFVIPTVFDRKDVEKVGQWSVRLAPFIALLVVAQFRADPKSWLNTGAGGGEGGQLESAYGKIRPPGPFSFVTGMVAYSSLLAAFILAHFSRVGIYGRNLAMVATVSMVICLGLSGSRGSIVSVVIVFLTAFYIARTKRDVGKFLMGPLFLITLAYFGLSLWSEFRLGLLVNEDRFGSGGIKEGLIMRFFSGLLEPFAVAGKTPFLGHGLGLGTNAGARLSTGSVGFLLGEGEWARVISESGAILGFAYIALRLAIIARLWMAASAQVLVGNAMPLLLFSACFLNILNGQFGQPTLLGFSVFGAGLCLAACRGVGDSRGSQEGGVGESALAVVANLPKGRSQYAEALHGGSSEPRNPAATP